MLIHPPELVCRVAVPLRGRFVKPVSSLGIIGWRALAVLKHVADVFFGGVVAMFCGFVAPGESFVVILRLAPSFLRQVAKLVFGHGVSMAGGEALLGPRRSEVP